MDNDKIVIVIGGTSVIALLGVLFGLSGILAGIVLCISTACAKIIFVKFGFEEDFSIINGFPIAILFISSLSFGLGLLFGLRNAFYISLVILITITAIVKFIPATKLKKHSKKLEA